MSIFLFTETEVQICASCLSEEVDQMKREMKMAWMSLI